MINKLANLLSTALYEPEMDEHRFDGLGGGQTHRLGPNFRPNQNILAGRGRGRRTRSMSPVPKRGPGGRGRGIEPGQLGIQMGTRPPPKSNIPKFSSHMLTSNEPTMRHVRPRVNVRAVDDMVAPTHNTPVLPASKPARPAQTADIKDPHVGQYVYPSPHPGTKRGCYV
jgi:hypothetical protein